MKHDFGYPFGSVECSDPKNVKIVTASCGGDCETGQASNHTFCQPGWEEDAKEAGGVVVANPVLDFRGWIALVEYPER